MDHQDTHRSVSCGSPLTCLLLIYLCNHLPVRLLREHHFNPYRILEEIPTCDYSNCKKK